MQYILSILPLLACPVGMGLMMWFMMRGNKQQTTGEADPAAGLTRDERLAELKSRLSSVQAEQEAIALKVTRENE